MKTSAEMYIISNKDGSKTVTDCAWIGLRLEKQSMADILYHAPITDNEHYFEKSDMNESVNNIQYYQSFEKAEIILNSLRNKENDPILETLKIVTLHFIIETEEKIYDEDQRLREFKHSQKVMESFEEDVKLIQKDETLDYVKFRKDDCSGYTVQDIQTSFIGWKMFKSPKQK